MNKLTQRLDQLELQFDEIIEKLHYFEQKYEAELNSVNPFYKKSALNLVHYLAFRSYDIASLQDELRDLSLPSLSNIEPHVLRSLMSIKNIISKLNGKEGSKKRKGIASIKNSKKILRRNTNILFGSKSKKRRTRIMVTLPNTAADDYLFVHGLLKSGMNCARVNCAHDDEETWKKMIENVKKANENMKKNCKVMMDLGGPKLRTGQMAPGAEILHIKPERDEYGNVIKPAKIWISTPDELPPDNTADTILPIEDELFAKIKRGNILKFKDQGVKIVR
jgi:pyruvate kinase